MRIPACTIAMSLFSSASFALPIPTEGLQYQLDASVPSTMIANEAGYVTNWSSCVGSVAFTNEDPDHLPYYDPDAFGGRGGMVFGYLKNGVTNYNWLTASAETDNRTIFFVYQQLWDLKQLPGGHTADMQLSGYWGKDGDGTSTYTIQGSSSQNGFWLKDSHWIATGLWANGVWQEVSGNNWYFDFGKAYRFGMEATELQTFRSAIGNVRHNMAHVTERRRNAYGAFAEMLVYDHELSSAERDYVELYLRSKWFGDAGHVTAWIGSGNWENAANWSDGVPTADSTVVITGGVANVSSSVSAKRILVGDCGFNFLSGAGLHAETIEPLMGEPSVVTINGGGTFGAKVCANVEIVKTGSDSRLSIDRVLPEFDGKMKVEAGTLAADISPYALPNLVVRLDASVADSVKVNDDGLVTNWVSQTSNGLSFTNDVPATATIPPPTYDTEVCGGLGGVRFGYSPQDGATIIATKLVADATVKAKTVVAVYDVTDTRPQGGQNPYRNHAFLGADASSQFGLLLFYWQWRSSTSSYEAPFYSDGCECWKDGNNNTMADVRNGCGQPHVVTAVVAASRDLPSKGEKLWVGMCHESYAHGTDRFLVGYLHEVLMYDRLLTTNEIEIVQKSLMEKWGVTPAAVLTNICNTLPPLDVTVASGATLDLGKASQTLKKLSGAGTVANGGTLTVTDGVALSGNMSVFADGLATPLLKLSAAAGFFPCLSLACDWDMTGTALELEPTADMKRGPLVTSAGELTGSFDPVTGLDGSGKIRYAPDRVVYSCGGLILLFR